MKLNCIGEVGEEKEYMVRSVDRITTNPRNINLVTVSATTRSGSKLEIAAKASTVKIQ